MLRTSTITMLSKALKCLFFEISLEKTDITFLKDPDCERGFSLPEKTEFSGFIFRKFMI